MNSKVERAVNQYTNRLAQSSENKKISSFKEIEFTSNFQDTQTSQSPLETAVLSAFNKKLVKNVGILALKESEWTPDLNAKLTKLEEYYQIMRKKSENALKKPIVSRYEISFIYYIYAYTVYLFTYITYFLSIIGIFVLILFLQTGKCRTVWSQQKQVRAWRGNQE